MTEEVSIDILEAPQKDLAELMREADRCFRTRKWSEGREIYEKIFEQEKNNAEVCERLVEIYAISGLFSLVLSQNYQLVRILDASGYPDKALQVAYRTLRLNPESETIRKKIILISMRKNDEEGFKKETLDLAHLYLEKGYEDHSLKLIRKLIVVFPDRPEFELRLADTYVKLGNIQEAANHYRIIANHFMEKGMKQEALKAFQRLKVLITPDVLALMTLGDLYVELGDFDAALDEYRTALKIDVNSEEALNALGNLCIEKGCYLDATIAFNKLLKNDPHNLELKERLAKLYILTNEATLSIEYYLEIAMHYSTSNDPASAMRYLKKVLELEPLNPVALKEIEKLEKDLGNR